MVPGEKRPSHTARSEAQENSEEGYCGSGRMTKMDGRKQLTNAFSKEFHPPTRTSPAYLDDVEYFNGYLYEVRPKERVFEMIGLD